jgi:hypothetical protein
VALQTRGFFSTVPSHVYKQVAPAIISYLEELASSVAESPLSGDERVEVDGHLGRQRGLDLDDDPAHAATLHHDVEEVSGIRTSTIVIERFFFILRR